MKRLIVVFCILLLILNASLILSSCEEQNTNSNPESPENALDGFSSQKNIEVDEFSIKYLKQSDYNNGDYSETNLVAEAFFDEANPYCYMVVDFTYRTLKTHLKNEFLTKFEIPGRGFLGMRVEEAATAKIEETADEKGTCIALSFRVPSIVEEQQKERIILRLAPISTGEVTVKVTVDHFTTKSDSFIVHQHLFQYRLNEDGMSYTLTRFLSDRAEDVDIPRVMADGFPVTAIGWQAFSDKFNLRKVSIPNSVVTIEKESFMNCYALSSVKLPSVTTVGESSFKNCISLLSVEAPIATNIGEGAFKGCEGLRSIEIPSVTTIGQGAFSDCTALKSVKVPLATSIGVIAFADCVSLTTVELSAVVTIGNEAFYRCENLSEIRYDGTKDQWNKILKGNQWSMNSGIVKIICSDGTVELQ